MSFILIIYITQLSNIKILIGTVYKGSDASVLIDSTPSSTTEKEFPVNNPSLRRFEVIDNAKAALELKGLYHVLTLLHLLQGTMWR